MNRNKSLSDSEWKLMNLLWEDSPRTIAQLFSLWKTIPDGRKDRLILTPIPSNAGK